MKKISYLLTTFLIYSLFQNVVVASNPKIPAFSKPMTKEKGNEWTNRHLITAVQHKNKNAVQNLLNDGADPNTIDLNTGETPLYTLANQQTISELDLEIAKLLHDEGADPFLKQLPAPTNPFSSNTAQVDKPENALEAARKNKHHELVAYFNPDQDLI